VSAISMSAPSSARSPIDMNSAAQMGVPLSPASSPIAIRAVERNVRRIVGLETPRAVGRDRETKTLRDPSAIVDAAARSTIGRPSSRTPIAEFHALSSCHRAPEKYEGTAVPELPSPLCPMEYSTWLVVRRHRHPDPMRA
jgi:hypothetical protein